MQISLFTCTCENNRVDKTNYLENRFVLDGYLKNNTSVIDPIIVIKKSNPAIYHYNYMYIADFDRWYFVNNIVSIRKDLWEVNAHVDVLYTWRVSILNSLALVDKTANIANANMYLDDGSFVKDSRTFNTVQAFPNALNLQGEYILICAGGSGVS